MYSQAAVLTVGCLITTLRTCQDSQRRWFFGQILTGTALMYTHNYGLFVVLGCALFSISRWLCEPLKSGPRLSLLALLAVGLAFSPWLIVLVTQSDGQGAAWISETWKATNPWIVLPESFAALTLSPNYPFHLVRLSQLALAMKGALSASSVGWCGLLIAASFFTCGVIRSLGRNGDPAGQLSLWVLAAGLISPFLYSLFIRPIYLVGRYDFILIGPVFVVIGVGVRSAWSQFAHPAARGLVAAMVVVWLIASGLFVTNWFRFGITSREQSIATWAKEQASPDDVVIAPGLSIVVTKYYWDRLDCSARLLPFPVGTGYSPGWIDEDALVNNLPGMQAEVDRLLVETRSTGHISGRIFLSHLVDSPSTIDDPLAEQLGLRLGAPRAPLSVEGLDGVEISEYGGNGD